MTLETLRAHRDDPETLAGLLSAEEIGQLVTLLSEKDDTVRYPAFLTLCARSRQHPDVSPYWDVFAEKLDDPNSYQRSIGAALLGLNVRWDGGVKFRQVFPRLMRQCSDEKPITARQTILTVPDWAEYAPELLEETVTSLTAIDLGGFRESMRKLVLTDIMNALLAIRELRPSAAIDAYLMKALTGGVLDKKSVREFSARMA